MKISNEFQGEEGLVLDVMPLADVVGGCEDVSREGKRGKSAVGVGRGFDRVGEGGGVVED